MRAKGRVTIGPVVALVALGGFSVAIPIGCGGGTGGGGMSGMSGMSGGAGGAPAGGSGGSHVGGASGTGGSSTGGTSGNGGSHVGGASGGGSHAGGMSGGGGSSTGGTSGNGGSHVGGSGGSSVGGVGGTSTGGGSGGSRGGAGGTPSGGTTGGSGGSHAGGAGGASAGGAGGASAGGAGGPSAGGVGGTSAGGSGGAGGAGVGGAGGISTVATPNLIVNGNAEAAVGSTDGAPVNTPAWTSTGEATAIEYGASGYPPSTVPGPADRGANFLAGGQNDSSSSLSQTIDVSSYASAIDAGRVTYVLSGYLGGWEDQQDAAVLQVIFQAAGTTSLGSASIGPVTASDRADLTEFLLRSATGAVPAGTRSIAVDLTLTRVVGVNNDGYADDLSLVLGGV